MRVNHAMSYVVWSWFVLDFNDKLLSEGVMGAGVHGVHLQGTNMIQLWLQGLSAYCHALSSRQRWRQGRLPGAMATMAAMATPLENDLGREYS